MHNAIMGNGKYCVASVFVGYDGDRKQIAITIMHLVPESNQRFHKNNIRLVYAKKFDFVSGNADFEQLAGILKDYSSDMCCFSCIEDRDRVYCDILERVCEVAQVVTHTPEVDPKDVHYQILTTYRNVLKHDILSFEEQYKESATDYKQLSRKVEMLNPNQLDNAIIFEPMEIDSLMISLFHGLLVCMKK